MLKFAFATYCRLSLQRLFVKHGGVVHDGEPVLSVTPGKPVTVTTSKATYTCDSVVLCLGPWMKEFCKTLGLNLPLQVWLLLCIAFGLELLQSICYRWLLQ